MKTRILFLNIIFLILFLTSTVISDEKISLNDEQEILINKYHVCEEYSECRFKTLIRLVEITDSRHEYYEPILANFVEHLVTVGDVAHWKKYEFLIDKFLEEDSSDGWKVYISSLWGWRLYSINEIRNFDKALKLLNYSIKTEGNVEMTGNAYYSLGVIYEQGRAVEQDFEKSIKFYLEAAKRGDPNAYYRVALHYILGNKKIKKDYNKAIKYLKLSNTSWLDPEVSMLKILFEKKRLPNDIKEFEAWVLSDYKKSKNVNNFIKLARGYEFINDYNSAFKYHYIVSKLLGEDNGISSIREIQYYKDFYIKEDSSKKLQTEADLIISNNAGAVKRKTPIM